MRWTDAMNERNAPEPAPGAISGRVTRRGAIHAPPPRLCDDRAARGRLAAMLRSQDERYPYDGLAEHQEGHAGGNPSLLMQTSAATPKPPASTLTTAMNTTSH